MTAPSIPDPRTVILSSTDGDRFRILNERIIANALTDTERHRYVYSCLPLDR